MANPLQNNIVVMLGTSTKKGPLPTPSNIKPKPSVWQDSNNDIKLWLTLKMSTGCKIYLVNQQGASFKPLPGWLALIYSWNNRDML